MKFKVKREDVKRNKILEATFKCVYERGAAAVTLRSIAEQAKVSQGLLHYYFKSKENLLAQFIEAALGNWADDLAKNMGRSYTSAEEKLEVFFKTGRDFAEKHGELLVVLQEIWSMSIRRPKLKKAFVESIRKQREIMEDILGQGEKENTFHQVREKTNALQSTYSSFVLGIGILSQLDRSIDFGAFDITIDNLKRIILKNPLKSASQ